jgi:hypothetical protein
VLVVLDVMMTQLGVWKGNGGTESEQWQQQ